jgi:hypothetical protein
MEENPTCIPSTTGLLKFLYLYTCFEVQTTGTSLNQTTQTNALRNGWKMKSTPVDFFINTRVFQYDGSSTASVLGTSEAMVYKRIGELFLHINTHPVRVGFGQISNKRE